jgi:hypothetical protein
MPIRNAKYRFDDAIAKESCCAAQIYRFKEERFVQLLALRHVKKGLFATAGQVMPDLI